MYLNATEKANDDLIIGQRTPRYYIGNYISPKRLGEDIKAYSLFGDYDGLQNVTATGLFSSSHGVFVSPSIHLRLSQPNEDYITSAGELLYADPGKMELRPEYAGTEGPHGPGAYYYPNAKKLGNITVEEASEVLAYALQKSKEGTLEPISVEEMASYIASRRELEHQESPESMGR